MTERACPDCAGTGQTGPVFVNGGEDLSKHYTLDTLPCRLCDGSGALSEDAWLAYREGRAMRRMRVALGLSLREASERLGIPASAVCDVERGFRALAEEEG